MKLKFSCFLSKSESCTQAILRPKSLTKTLFPYCVWAWQTLFSTRCHFLACYKIQTKAVLLAALTSYWLFYPRCSDHTDHFTKTVTFWNSTTVILVLFPPPPALPFPLSFLFYCRQKEGENEFCSVIVNVRVHTMDRRESEVEEGRWSGNTCQQKYLVGSCVCCMRNYWIAVVWTWEHVLFGLWNVVWYTI
jgi:hypothetical protein